jgi:hypothetical protein
VPCTCSFSHHDNGVSLLTAGVCPAFVILVIITNGYSLLSAGVCPTFGAAGLCPTFCAALLLQYPEKATLPPVTCHVFNFIEQLRWTSHVHFMYVL